MAVLSDDSFEGILYDEAPLLNIIIFYRRQLYIMYTVTTLFIRDNHYFKLSDKS